MTTPKPIHPDVNGHTLDFAMDFMDQELAKLESLAIVLTNQLCPSDPKNPSDDDDVISWNLAQVLSERLGNVNFSNSMRELLRLEVTGETA
jgi:hypothetical protein